jgi:UDP-N-acetylglucosamine:LPS N-acetylglucosamine transferase
MSIPAELRNARMLVNRGHGDVSDEPDPLHEAAADEIERLDRELEALEKTNEHLRAALKRIVDLRHLSSTREMAEIAAFALRGKHYGT